MLPAKKSDVKLMGGRERKTGGRKKSQGEVMQYTDTKVGSHKYIDKVHLLEFIEKEERKKLRLMKSKR